MDSRDTWKEELARFADRMLWSIEMRGTHLLWIVLGKTGEEEFVGDDRVWMLNLRCPLDMQVELWRTQPYECGVQRRSPG